MRYLLIGLALVLPNIFFLGAATWLGIGRPWFNVDYAFVLLLFAFGWRRSGIVLAVIFLLIEVLALGGQVLPFVRLADVLYLLQFVGSASRYHVVLLVVVCVVIFLQLGLMITLGRRLSKVTALLLFNVLLAVYAVRVNFFEPNAERFYRAASGVWVGSQAVSFMQGRSEGFLESFDGEGVALQPAAAGATRVWLDALEADKLPRRLLLIVNESWGVPVQQATQDHLLKPLLSAPLVFSEQGSLPFTGTTVGAELRELCQLRAEHFNLAGVEVGFESCLPNLLSARGYATYSMHGAMSLLYDRKYWYPRAGFDHSLFYEGVLDARRCFSFPGACDLDLFPVLGRYFTLEGARFFYWLTLNSHIPYDKRDIHVDAFDCAAQGVEPDGEACRNLKLQAQFFAGLAELIKSPDMHGVEVIVVGDHPPVMMSARDNSRHFKQGQVPWIHFKVGAVQ